MLIPSASTVIPAVSAGGAEYDPLVPPSAPAAQALASGSTSSSAISWGSPTGGSGSTTTADVLTQDVGSGASLSGGAVVGLEDGDVVRVKRTWTDSTTGQPVSAVTTVSVASAVAGAEWTQLADIDLTTADTLAGINSGTLAVTTDSGATSLCSIVVDPDGTATHTVGVTNGVGLVFVSPSTSGRITAAGDLAALLGLTAQQMVSGVLCVQMAWTSIDCDLVNEVIRGAVGVGTDAGDGTDKGGFRYIRASGSTVTPTTILDGANTVWGSAISTPTDTALSLYVVGGREVYVVYDPATSTLPSPSLSHMLGGRSTGVTGAAAADGSGLPIYDGDPLYAQVSVGAGATIVCPRIRISRYG